MHKIRVRLMIFLKNKNENVKRVEIGGTFFASVTPAKGSLIFWPYGEVTIPSDEDLACRLIVTSSYFLTVEPGTVLPCVDLSQAGEDTLGDPTFCRTVFELGSCIMGAKLLLHNPMVRWPNNHDENLSEWQLFPHEGCNGEGVPQYIYDMLLSD